MALTRHARQRAAQRNLSEADVRYVMEVGRRVHRAGAIFYYLGHDDIPADDRRDARVTRLIGTAVVCARDRRVVLTVWRNRRRGLSRIKRKPRFGCPPAWES